jgi:hypothetical protein
MAKTKKIFLWLLLMAFLFSHSWASIAQACELCIAAVKMAKEKEDLAKAPQLRFSTLMTWDYKPGGNHPPPEKIKELNDRTVRLTGFMFPMQEGKSIQNFCLLRTTRTRCHGPRSQYNQYVFVEMAEPIEFHRLDRISIVGTFKVEPTPQKGFIYRLEGKSCETLSKK